MENLLRSSYEKAYETQHRSQRIGYTAGYDHKDADGSTFKKVEGPEHIN